jgi:hypothetical protein
MPDPNAARRRGICTYLKPRVTLACEASHWNDTGPTYWKIGEGRSRRYRREAQRRQEAELWH